MPVETLEFEEPIAVLLKEIDALGMLPQTDVRDAEIASLRRRIDQIRGEIYSRLTPWQRVLVARHPSRPYMLDYVERLCTDFIELHGDRRFGDDGAIVCGFARYHDQPVMMVGHQKGRDTKQKVHRNFGYARPEGYRKALRAMKLAEKFTLPVVVLVDTPAAFPGVESEERGIAEAIAVNLREMAVLRVPIVIAITGEGGSGGALGLAIGDTVMMQEFSVYSVIPPEGCAAILWRDASRKVEATEALKMTAPDLLERRIVDQIVREPLGGAHQDPDEAARLLDAAIAPALAATMALTEAERLDRRYAKFRNMGRIGLEISDGPITGPLPGAPVSGGSPGGARASAAGGGRATRAGAV